MQQINWLHLLLLGTMLYQSVFMLVQWSVYKRKEYLYYVSYILASSLFLVFRLDNTLRFLPFHLSGMADEYLDQPLIIFGIWMYIRFGYYFLQLKELQPKVYRSAVRLEWCFIVFIAIKFLIIPFNLPYHYSAYIYLAAVSFLSLAAVQVIVRLLLQKNLLNNYLVLGSLCITIGGAAGPILALFLPAMGKGNLILYIGLEIGIMIELLLLNTGLVIKNKLMQQEVIDTQQKLIGQLKQTSVLRNNLDTLQLKLSSDLHDDMGASLSSIQLYIEVIEKVFDKDFAKAKTLLSQVKINTRDIIENMGDIVWALNASKANNTTFEEKLKNYCYKLLAPKDISCFIEIPDWFHGMVTNIHVLRNLMMVSKECLNNVAKYSGASHCELLALHTNTQLLIKISDDGIGFDKANAKGNGLKNIQQRIKSIGGQIIISTNEGLGTEIGIMVPKIYL